MNAATLHIVITVNSRPAQWAIHRLASEIDEVILALGLNPVVTVRRPSFKFGGVEYIGAVRTLTVSCGGVPIYGGDRLCISGASRPELNGVVRVLPTWVEMLPGALLMIGSLIAAALISALNLAWF